MCRIRHYRHVGGGDLNADARKPLPAAHGAMPNVPRNVPYSPSKKRLAG
jgi:hypothetical protein